MAVRRRSLSERGQLDLFRARPGDFALRDAQDLMAYPFFSLSKSHRVAPIDFVAGNVTIRVEAVPDHGMATIWDADILIWAASQIVEARDAGLRTSRLMAATPYEILTYVGRGTSLRDYQRLKAALDRLQSTTVATSIRQPAEGRRHRFSWINEWQERTDRNGRPEGIELIVPDWFYQAVLDDALVLTIDRAYFDLTGGLDRWLYRLVRKHGGRQRNGWRFDFRHLHQKSGSLSPFKRFAFELRDIIRRQPLPGYTLFLEVEIGGRTLLAFEPTMRCGQPVDGLVLSGTRTIVLSGTGGSCYREPKPSLTAEDQTRNRALNLESNIDSNLEERARDVDNLARDAAGNLGIEAGKGADLPPATTAPTPSLGKDDLSTTDHSETLHRPRDPSGGRR
ncbi:MULTISPECIES: replication initiator protein A [unclassified Afipia]|nr:MULTISPECIES: replication initiator protein A [unclassified Afipia]